MYGKKIRTSVSIPEKLQEAVMGVTSNFSQYVSEAVEERLKNEGVLPAGEEELRDLELVREARASGVDVRSVITEALKGDLRAL